MSVVNIFRMMLCKCSMRNCNFVHILVTHGCHVKVTEYISHQIFSLHDGTIILVICSKYLGTIPTGQPNGYKYQCHRNICSHIYRTPTRKKYLFTKNTISKGMLIFSVVLFSDLCRAKMCRVCMMFLEVDC